MVRHVVERALTTIGFDADDTLWSHAPHYGFAEQRFVEFLSHVEDAPAVLSRLRTVEAANLPLYGFGVKGFVLSMIEAATTLCGGRFDDAVASGIIACGKVLLEHPIALLPHAGEVVSALAERYRLILITRGDLFDQERKIAASGLAKHFSTIEIVSDKTAQTYARVFGQHADGARRAAMVGNSLGSDVLPAIAAGAWGIYVPQEVSWVMEHGELPVAALRFRQIPHLGDLPAAMEEIERGDPEAGPAVG